MICSVDTDVGHNLVTRQPIKSLPVCRTYQLWVGSDFEMSDCELILTSPVSERWFSPWNQVPHLAFNDFLFSVQYIIISWIFLGGKDVKRVPYSLFDNTWNTFAFSLLIYVWQHFCLVLE